MIILEWIKKLLEDKPKPELTTRQAAKNFINGIACGLIAAVDIGIGANNIPILWAIGVISLVIGLYNIIDPYHRLLRILF